MNGKVGVVIVNWNGWRDTIECLDSLACLSYTKYTVYVVDNDSKDESADRINSYVLRNASCGFSSSCQKSDQDEAPFSSKAAGCVIRLIRSSVNGGFAAGNNIGIRAALDDGCDYVWLLNNDTVVDPESLSALVECVSSNEKIGMCGSVLRYYDQRDVVQAYGGVAYSFWRAQGRQLGQGVSINSEKLDGVLDSQLTYVSGASMLMRRDFILDVGLMEESYFLYFEEIDWAVRAAGRWATAVARKSMVFHREGGSIGTASRSKRSLFSQYYLSRNLVRFYVRHKFALLPIAIARLFREGCGQLLQGDWVRVRVTCVALLHGCIGKSGASCPDAFRRVMVLRAD